MLTDLNFDREHLWHPYTSTTHPLPCYPVARAKGVTIELEDGRQLIDGMSSWWSAIHGYNHPKLNQAVIDQIDKMSHIMFGGLTHAPATTLGQHLISMTDPKLNKVFLADSGSVSVEVALKMALQYQQGIGQSQRTKLMTVRGGYHGDTFAAMSVCDPVGGMHRLFSDILPKAHFLPQPSTPFDQPLTELDRLALHDAFAKWGHDSAAVILEPIVQGAGGMHFYGASYLNALQALCDQHGVLLIFDEIATGFGRTGQLFAYQHTDVVPDILCLGKALTGGYMTLAATLCSDTVAAGVCASEAGVFMHGPTFMGNPLACAVASASLALLQTGQWQNQVQLISQQLEQELAPCRQLSKVVEVRTLGAIGVVELAEPVDMETIQAQFVAAGVWVRPFGKLIYVMPPFVIQSAQLSRLTQAIYQILA